MYDEDGQVTLAELDDIDPAPNKSLSLMLHCGGQYSSWKQVKTVKCPEPTKTYFPIPHHELFQQVQKEVMDQGANIIQTAHALAHDGKRYFALMEIEDKNFDGGTTIIGIRNGHDRKVAWRLALGNKVFICDNLAICGEVGASRRHTRYIARDIPVLIAEAVGQLKDQQKIQKQRVGSYMEHRLSKLQGHDAVIQLMDAEAFPKTKITDVLELWRTDERWGADPTVWRMFNSVTAALRGGNLWTHGERTLRLHEVCDSLVGLDTQPAMITV